mmetsp:Transcript_73014/g.146969  ORF Transcript_73014/g.146969 Transcript_73014/m.146969 type:complete len:260 (+) Transcript_73014:1043-1822(+)
MKKKMSSCRVAAMRYVKKFFMRWKMTREMKIASTIVFKPGWVSTMSAAALAASVAPWTAIPTSARLRAGASLTPSPVMPVLWPSSRRHSTIKNLCSGNTCANPSAGAMIFPYDFRLLGVEPSSLSMGKWSGPSRFVPMSSCRAVSLAMSRWSPVTILTFTPYSTAWAMVALVSRRGGSKKVRSPIIFHWPVLRSHLATPMARMPRRPNACTSASHFSATAASLQSLRITFGAPFVVLNLGPPLSLTVPSVRFTTGSKGM